MVKALPAHRFQEALVDWIQKGRTGRDLCDLDAHPLDHGINYCSELVIVVSDDVLRFVTGRRGLSEYLGHSGVGRAAGHIEVNDFSVTALVRGRPRDGTGVCQKDSQAWSGYC